MLYCEHVSRYEFTTEVDRVIDAINKSLSGVQQFLVSIKNTQDDLIIRNRILENEINRLKNRKPMIKISNLIWCYSVSSNYENSRIIKVPDGTFVINFRVDAILQQSDDEKKSYMIVKIKQTDNEIISCIITNNSTILRIPWNTTLPNILETTITVPSDGFSVDLTVESFEYLSC